jgi:hypothetical protein
MYYLKLLRASEGMLSRLYRLQYTRMVCYGPFSLCLTYKEGLCPSSGDINRLMLMMMIHFSLTLYGDPAKIFIAFLLPLGWACSVM